MLTYMISDALSYQTATLIGSSAGSGQRFGLVAFTLGGDGSRGMHPPAVFRSSSRRWFAVLGVSPVELLDMPQ